MNAAALDPLAALQAGALHRFSDRPHPCIPAFAAGVYAIWLDGGAITHAAMAGRSIALGMADETGAAASGPRAGRGRKR